MENKLRRFEKFLSGENTLDLLFQQFDGYWDLKDIKKDKAKNDLKSFNSNFKFSGKRFENIDFSGSDFSLSEFRKCKFLNCIFKEVNMQSITVVATTFENCIFQKTNFKGSYLFSRINYDFGGLKSCKIEDCDFKVTTFGFPLIEDTDFLNCNLKSIDFNGSRFKGVKFVGKLDDVRFRGLGDDRGSWFVKTFFKIDPNKHRNIMDGVDFSGANLIYTLFSHSIDISRCIFPKDKSNYFLIKNHKQVFDNAKQALSVLNEMDRKSGVRLIDMLFYNEDVRTQNIVFMDKIGPRETQKDEVLNLIYSSIENSGGVLYL